MVAVWFRCQLLPFQALVRDPRRADSMREAYSTRSDIPALSGVVVVDLPDKQPPTRSWAWV